MKKTKSVLAATAFALAVAGQAFLGLAHASGDGGGYLVPPSAEENIGK